MTLRQTLSKLLMQLIGGRKDVDSNDVSEGDEAEIEENTEESGDEDSFESDSDSTEDEASGDNDHFDLDYTRHEDVRTVVETMMTARRTHRNRMHAYFKKFPSKEAALLKPHPDTTEEQWKELCDLFTSEAFMKRSEQNKKNRSKLTVNHAAGSRSFQRTRACMKQAEMEATLRDHREEQRVEQERIRLERRSACNRNKSACERSKSAYGQKYRRNWRRKCPL
ncbi:hypothetical protein CJ030_MR0G008966 [Morella rubra]|uniref:Uncharacterized protein n=1 Tax=Morella rubra TaxID=262757 RepID=A0A6A1UIT6_9ROSI|nr:hypothetical protein CJ030_MR0G008966 [Morella rubra]